jgi:transglutaminase/protease-like cytokinesis protein 3
MGISKPISRR